jgi:hypothetical protein
MQPKPARRLLRCIGIAMLVTAVAVAALLKATPDTYRRVAGIGPEDPAAAKFTEQLINPLGNVLLDKSGGTSLDVTLTEDVLNARLAEFLAETRAGGARLPPVLENVRVAFEPGVLFVGTRVGSGSGSVVVSHRLRLSATDDGRLLAETVALRAGMMPVPRSLVGQVAAALRLTIERAERKKGDAGGLAIWHGALDALEGKPVSLVYESGRKVLGIHLEKVEVGRGSLHVVGRRIEQEPAKP